MRIIDNKHDFYDYMQDSTDTIVFDRRGSYELTKRHLYNSATMYENEKSKYRFVLLQCGATFWLFILTTVSPKTFYEDAKFDVDFLGCWKNFDKPNELLKLSAILPRNNHKMYDYKIKDYDLDKIKANVRDIIDSINHNDFRVLNEIDRYEREEEHKYMLLKSSGLVPLIDTQEIFCAIEEYFSIEKTKAETTEAKGTTNDIKITSHGFDLKTSFRGK